MSYRLYRHPDVEQDLFDIVDLIAHFAGPEIARRKLGEIEKTLHNLRQLPHAGSLRNDILPNLRAIPVARKGVITFFVDDEAQSVFVVSVTYAEADCLSRLLDRRGSGSE